MIFANSLFQYSSSAQARNEYLKTVFSHANILDSRPKALIVEDDVFAQKYFRKVLNDRFPDMQTTVVSGYDEALSAVLREGPFDIVILDIFLSGDRNGLQIYETFQNMNTKPVILMTSALDPETYRSLFPPGSVPPPFLQKPFHPDECASIVEAVSGWTASPGPSS